ncbi:MAG: HEAT repeat domain-containing protein [Microthrixaceae bacterium]
MIDNDYERLRNVVVAGHSGDIELARSGLADRDARVRAAAVGSMDRLGELGATALSEALRDPEPGVRRRAAEVAAGRREAIPSLLEGLGDDHPMVAEAAAFALGEMHPADSADDSQGPSIDMATVVESLSRVCREHADALCRESAAAALGSLGHPGGLAAVLAACADKAPVRRRAVLALAAFDGPEVTDMLEHLSDDRDLQVRQAAEDLLAIERGSDI